MINILNYLGNAKFRLHDNEGSIRLYSESVICSPVRILKIRKKILLFKKYMIYFQCRNMDLSYLWHLAIDLQVNILLNFLKNFRLITINIFFWNIHSFVSRWSIWRLPQRYWIGFKISISKKSWIQTPSKKRPMFDPNWTTFGSS